MSGVTIQLAKPIALDGQQIDAVTLRPPTLAEIGEFGELVEFVDLGDGVRFTDVHYDRVGMAIRTCVSSPDEAETWIDGVGLHDTCRLAIAMLLLWHSTRTTAASMPGLPSNQPKSST